MTPIARRSLAVLAAGLAFAAGAAQAAWPERPITLIVPWGAGGGTDATARIIGSLLEKELGQPVNVVNRTGGSGVVGHAAIAAAPPDGYTIGLATVEIGMMHWQGLTELDRRRPTRRSALVNADPAGIQVRADCAVQDRARTCWPRSRPTPASSRPRGTGQGGIWHLAHRRHAARPEDRPGSAALGAAQRRRARPAGHGGRRRRDRAVLAARGALADRRRQGAQPGDHGRQAGGALSRTCRR